MIGWQRSRVRRDRAELGLDEHFSHRELHMRFQRTRGRAVGQIAIATVGSTVYNLSQWGLLVVISRLSDQASVGLYSYALAVTAPIALLFGMNMRQSYVTEDLNRWTFWPYYNLRVGSAIVLVVLFGLISTTLPNGGVVMFAIGFAKVLDLLGDYLLAVSQKVGNLAHLGIANSINGLVTFSTVFLALVMGVSVELSLALTVCGSLAALVYVVCVVKQSNAEVGPLITLRWWRRIGDPIPRLRPWRLFVTLIPLGLAAGMASARVTLPRYALEAYWGLEMIGVFSAALHITTAANALVMALAQFSLPNLVSRFRQNGPLALRRPIFQLCAFWLVVGVIVTILAYFYGPWMLGAIYGPEYVTEDLMWVLAVSWALSSVASMVDLGLTTLRQFQLQLYVNVVAFIVTIIAVLAVVPNSGLLGTAWAAVVSAFALLVVRVGFLWHSTRSGAVIDVGSS